MFRFLIKKSFFAGVDNAFILIVSNVISAGLLAVYLIVSKVINQIAPVSAALIVFFTTAVLCFYLTGVYAIANEWSCFKSSWIDAFISALKKKTGHSLLFFIIVLFVAFSILICIPFYATSKSYVGIFLAFTLFWIVIILSMAAMYFFPLAYFFPEDTAFQTFKKCFSFMFCEKGFTISVFLKTIFELTLSVVTCFLLPGFTGIAISHNSAVRLIMIKQEKKALNISYKELFSDENDCIGPRKLKNIFFPWKD